MSTLDRRTLVDEALAAAGEGPRARSRKVLEKALEWATPADLDLAQLSLNEGRSAQLRRLGWRAPDGVFRAVVDGLPLLVVPGADPGVAYLGRARHYTGRPALEEYAHHSGRVYPRPVGSLEDLGRAIELENRALQMLPPSRSESRKATASMAAGMLLAVFAVFACLTWFVGVSDEEPVLVHYAGGFGLAAVVACALLAGVLIRSAHQRKRSWRAGSDQTLRPHLNAEFDGIEAASAATWFGPH